MATTVQAILQQHYAEFAASHPLADYQRLAAARMRDCRTAKMGGHWRSCPNGHVQTPHYNSCKHRSCPLCSALDRERWLAGWKARLLDCPHGHLTFTVVQELRVVWRYNKQLFAELLFQSATRTVRELFADEEYVGGLPGLLAGLHTWGQALQEHVHLHVLVTWGGWTEDGRWVEPKKSCLFPRHVPMHLFRGKLLAALRKALDRGKLTLPPNQTECQLRSLLNRLGRVVWNVDVPDRYEHGEGVATYLARYLKGGPLSNGRLVDLGAGVVGFWYRDNRDEDEDGRGRRKLLRLSPSQFLARLLEHVPPPNLQTVRGYGLYANNQRALRAEVRQHLGQAPEVKPPKVSWRELCQRLGRDSETVCPVCGAPLVVHGRFGPGVIPSPPKLAPPELAQPPPAKVA